ncbi:hypothetical protein THAOC_15376 [Thalassiosira oceanica]|uniref:Uncharacterized protein n=1 Tax=Thalassiosira oceanica TaxID=159749 RepID=K0SCS1_THAOC|nr:hypothetical protein THAOC_15376 [Thalassiosira oceanica]|eukprot:EJK63938.1 hypothetical protein THAOC_15376 [Thalassiosira oceanica]
MVTPPLLREHDTNERNVGYRGAPCTTAALDAHLHEIHRTHWSMVESLKADNVMCAADLLCDLPGGQQTTSEEMPMIQQGLGSSNVFPQTLGKTGQDRPIDTAQAWKDTTEGILAQTNNFKQADKLHSRYPPAVRAKRLVPQEHGTDSPRDTDLSWQDKPANTTWATLQDTESLQDKRLRNSRSPLHAIQEVGQAYLD